MAVVYLDQQIGAPHAGRNNFFITKTMSFSITKGKRKENAKKTFRNK